MAYTQTNSRGTQYFLHMRDQELRGGRIQRIYFFAKDVRPEKGTPIEAIPDGHIVKENSKTGLLVLARS